MANNIFQERITPDKPKVLTGERVYVYVPKAGIDESGKETAGIASFNKDNFVVNDGKVNIHPDILNQIDENTEAIRELGENAAQLTERVEAVEDGLQMAESDIEALEDDVRTLQNTKVDKEYGYSGSGVTDTQSVVNGPNGLELKYEQSSGGLTLTKHIDGRDLRLFETARGSSGLAVDKRTELQIKNPNNIVDGDIEFHYNKYDFQNPNKKIDEFNGEIATRPYVDAKDELVRGYVDNKVTEIKKSIGYVFDTFVNFVAWIDGSYIRPDGVVVNDLNVGDDIFIVEEGIPDYWVKSKSSPMTIADFAPYESGDYKPTIMWLED